MELTLAGHAALGPGSEPAPELLPPNERRRASASVRWALAAGQKALGARLQQADGIATVFACCGGDGVITNQICEALANSPQDVSPTRFHNSVHNAPAGYWSIATRSRAPSTSLCAYDGTFGAGLLEAAAQVTVEDRSVLLVAYDLPHPAPLDALWPIGHPFAAALLLDPAHRPGKKMRVEVRPGAARTAWPATLPGDLSANPAAHALAVLELVAAGEKRSVEISFTDDSHVCVEIG